MLECSSLMRVDAILTMRIAVLKFLLKYAKHTSNTSDKEILLHSMAMKTNYLYTSLYGDP